MMIQLPEMAPHTAAKHLLLKRYLDAWFPILGRRHQRINYIDGFAGPGQYRGGQEGSPIIAIKSALQHIERGTLSRAVQINFLFIESDRANLDHLNRQLEAVTVPASFRVKAVAGAFRDVIEPVLGQFEAERSSLAPTFAFVDPFGFKGIPFRIMERILSHPSCEVFVNVMVDFMNRFLEHPNDNVVRHVPETFGTDDVLRIPQQEGDRKRALLELYRTQLRTQATYVGRFDMASRRNKTIYSLFFASNSAKGFEKMKKAMWAVAPGSGSLFSDADPRGLYAFDLFGTSALRDELLDRFRGQLVPMSDLETFVVRETDYLPKHAREHLKQLEEQGRIEVVCAPGHKRRSFTYPSTKVSIRFR